MDFVVRRQFVERLLILDGRQGHLGLELGAVQPPQFPHLSAPQ